jgi:cytochrome c oxidase subunit 2
MQHKHILLAIAVASLAACAPSSSDTGSGSVMGGSSSAMTVKSSAPAMEAKSSAPAAAQGDVRVVDVKVTDWSFAPATVTAKKGEKVQLRLTDDEGIHSLLVADLGLNVRVSPGETTVIDLATDKAGTFEGRCGVPCGPGHRDMKFTIVVE